MDKNIIVSGDQPLDGKHRTEQRQVVKQKVITGRLMKRPGQTVFEYNLSTDECKPAIIESVDAHLKDNSKPGMQQDVTIRHTVKQRDGYLYCAALNQRNADRKFAKMIAELVKKGTLIKQS